MMETIKIVETHDVRTRETTTTSMWFVVRARRKGEVIARWERATEDEAADIVRREMRLGECDEVELVEHRSVDHWIRQYDIRWHEETDEVISRVMISRPDEVDADAMSFGPRTMETLRELVLHCDGASV